MIRRLLLLILLAGLTGWMTGAVAGCNDEQKTVRIREYQEPGPVEPVSPGEPVVE